jgi:hypothetical protein
MLRIFLLAVIIVVAGVGGGLVISGHLPAQEQPACDDPRCG